MPKKRTRTFLSQNFLVDEDVACALVEAFHIDPRDAVLEIGPGRGVLSAHLLESSRNLVLVEKDRRLVHVLQNRFGTREGLTILSSDILELDLHEVRAAIGERKFRVIGLIPYHITTPILMRLIEQRESVEDALFVVQREVALRIAARPGNRHYGALSVAVQYWAEPILLFAVARECFSPRPAVQSHAIALRFRREPAVHPKCPELFFFLVRMLFTQRRKQVQKALRAHSPLDVTPAEITRLEQCTGISLQKRPEELSLNEFSLLSDAILEGREESNFFHSLHRVKESRSRR